MRLHWDVFPPIYPRTFGADICWKVQLCDGQRFYGDLFTFYDFGLVIALVKRHHTPYPVSLTNCFGKQEQAAEKALTAAGIELAGPCIPF